jgi:hypothetical protein
MNSMRQNVGGSYGCPAPGISETTYKHKRTF